MRQNAKFNPYKWEYTPDLLNEKLTGGTVDDPYFKHRGISGKLCLPDQQSRNLKIKRDLYSGNLIGERHLTQNNMASMREYTTPIKCKKQLFAMKK